jgi:hypothetical protein
MAAMADLGWKAVTRRRCRPAAVPPGEPTVLDTRTGTGRNGLVGKIGPAGSSARSTPPWCPPPHRRRHQPRRTNGTANSLLTVWPDDGSTPPTLSNVNFGANQTINNRSPRRPVTHRIAVANLAGSTDIVADLLGYYDGGADPTGQHYVAIDPTRVIDTRTGPAPAG